MAAGAADVINLDLEDSVAPSDKDIARSNIISALQDLDWGKKQCRCGLMAWTLRIGIVM